jgi:arabinose-5-phosphate isomerase
MPHSNPKPASHVPGLHVSGLHVSGLHVSGLHVSGLPKSGTGAPDVDASENALDAVSFARRVLRREGEALIAQSEALEVTSFRQSLELLLQCEGRVIVTGMGKAGLVGNKLAATLASTGTCAHFVHPGEAYHGDLGRFHPTDVAIILSRSGETEEVTRILPSLTGRRIPIIAITAVPTSSLGRAATAVLKVMDVAEVCSLQLAPSTSTTTMLAIGDALALTLSRERGFRSADFVKFHPGGSLGRKLMPVDEIMRHLHECRLANWTQSVRAVVAQQRNGRRSGAVMLIDDETRLIGIFTDSDLARLVADPQCDLDRPVHEVMTTSPKTIISGGTVDEAISKLDAHRISELPVVSETNVVLGLIDITDLIGTDRARLDSTASGQDRPILKITHLDQTSGLRTA